MWFLVIAIPALAGTVTSLFNMTGGPKFAMAAVGLDQYQRRKGYKGGEGWASHRPSDVYVIPGYKNPDSPISETLGMLAAFDKESFAPYINKRFDPTDKEAEFMATLLSVTEPSMHRLSRAYLEYISNPDNRELVATINECRAELKMLQQPILHYLKDFPAGRVKAVIV